MTFILRSLRRTPGFTAAVVASLALGLTLTAATAAVVNAYLARSLPYPDAGRLYHVMYAPPGPWEPRGMTSLDWRSVEDVVEHPITARTEVFYLTDGDSPRSVRGARVNPGFIAGLGARAVVGRTLSAHDFAGGSERAALIGHGLWRERYGADPAIVGRLLRMDADTGGTTEVFRVVGVLAPDFYFGRDSRDTVDVLVALSAPARTYMVRLREGVPPDLAEQRITEAARAVASGLPPDWTGVHLESVHGRYVAGLQPVLTGVTIASGLVLVIVFANVAVLIVLRTMRRQKEFAVRAALGSGRWRLARMLLAETALLCAAALAAGLLLARLALGLLAPMIEARLGRPAPGGAGAFSLEGMPLAVVAAAGAAIALSLAFLPLAMPWQRRIAEALRRDGATATDGVSMRRLRSTLIACEIAGTLVLFVACGLTVRSVLGMVRTDLGFDEEHLVRTRIVLRGAGYPDAAAFSRFYERFAERLAATAGTPVVFTNWPPFIELATQAVEPRSAEGARSNAGALGVSAGYFAAFGIALRAGRDFTRADVAGPEPVAVVSETLAGRLWPVGNALGRYVRAIQPTPEGPRPGPWREVVGVAADVRQTYGDADLGDIYVPQSPTGRYGSFYIRTGQPLGPLAASMRSIAAGIDPHAMVDQPKPVESENRQLAGTRFMTALLTGLAAMAGFLAVLGIYGVTAYAVQQRQREIAIRMAVGAAEGDVVRLFLRESGLVLGAGLALGLAGAAAAARLLESQLYAVRAFDVPTLAATSAALCAVGLLAAWWPARRASRRSPVTALKDA